MRKFYRNNTLLLRIFCVFAFLGFNCKGQNLDSLLSLLNSAKEDTGKLNILFSVAKAADTKNHQEALKYWNQELGLAKKLNWEKSIARSNFYIGVKHWESGNFNLALVHHFKALQVYKSLNDLKGVAMTYQYIGKDYVDPGNYPKALHYLNLSLASYHELNDKRNEGSVCLIKAIAFGGLGNYPEATNQTYKALGLFEDIDFRHGIAVCYSNLSARYMEDENYSEALKLQFRALKTLKKINDYENLSYSYSEIGFIFINLGKLEKAKDYFLLSKKIAENHTIISGLGSAYLGLGNVCLKQNQIQQAIYYYEQSIIQYKSESNNYSLLPVYAQMGSCYTKLKKFELARNYLNITLQTAQKINSVIGDNSFYGMRVEIDSATGDWENAFANYKIFIKTRDSIFNKRNSKKIMQSKIQYEFDKKSAAIRLAQEKKDAQQLIIRNAILIGLTVVLIFLLIVYRQRNKIRKEKKEVEKQRNIIQEKNSQILDSIEYALRIQTAILPPSRIVKQNLVESFVVYMPKDIVAGDFYWMETKTTDSGQELILFAACDCTGHGVPGAMVSVMCHNALNRSVREFGLIQPAAILDKVTELVIENFKESDQQISDGMDASLCAYYPKQQRLEWSGAHNPLWIIRNGILLETKANPQPVGIYDHRKPFTNHSIDLLPKDTIYIFTDGFSDQFGGNEGNKKLTKRNFKELLLSIQEIPIQRQGDELISFITKYRNQESQVDDILVMGVRV